MTWTWKRWAKDGDDDEDQVGDGRADHHGEVEVALGRDHAVVDGVLGERGPDLGGHRDHHHQDPGQGQHARVLGQQPPQAQSLELVLGAVLAEDDVGLGILGLGGQQLVHPVLELVGDAGEGQAGGGRGLRPSGAAEAPATAATEHHDRPPPRTESSRSAQRLAVGLGRCLVGAQRGLLFGLLGVGLPFELARLGQHLGVERSGLEQLGVGPVGHDLVLVQQDHPVGQRDGGQPVGDDQGGAALHLDPQSGMDPLLDLDVDGAGGVVEHHDGRVDQQGPGDGDPLALTAGEGVAPLAHHRVVAVGQVG